MKLIYFTKKRRKFKDFSTLTKKETFSNDFKYHMFVFIKFQEKQLWASGLRNGFTHHSSKPSRYGTLSTKLLTDYNPYQHHKLEHSLVCVEVRGRISRAGLTQDIKMGSTATGLPCVCIL